MVARLVGALVCVFLLGACAVINTPPVFKIALLAPFEGEYRDLGYNALYAARLALRDDPNYLLLAVDDGGTEEQAARHAAALAQDPSVVGVLLVGQFATSSSAQNALNGLPAIVVGFWSASPTQPNIVQLASENSATFLVEGMSDERIDMASTRRATTEAYAFLSSGSLPDDTYLGQYRAESEFAPVPNTLATLVSDATDLLVTAHNTQRPIAEMEMQLRNGTIRFANGFWVDAPMFRYQWNLDGTLSAIRLN